jgi:hypothetical protein
MLKLINCESYKSLCNWIYDDEQEKTPPSNRICFVPNDHIAEFFDVIRSSPHRFVVVSTRSDYGICYQALNPVANDMLKWIEFTVRPKGYDPLLLAPRCNVQNCNLQDKYSVKMEYFTTATFNEIPQNVVHWFVVNGDLPPNSRITNMPFGVPSSTEDMLSSQKMMLRDDRVYVNFQLYNTKRAYLLERLRDESWCHVEFDVPHEDFVRALHTYKYVLCPTGNGLDTYRILEAIYAGCIPIVESGYWAQAYEKLPVIFINNMFGLSKEVYKQLPSIDWAKFPLENSRADLNYWAARIKEKSVELTAT